MLNNDIKCSITATLYVQNKTDSAVRITHLPTNIVVQCQNERSQLKNKNVAMKVLRSRLYELRKKELDAKVEKLMSEKKDIAWGSQIRSYVFQPYQMVKDHRTGVESGNVTASWTEISTSTLKVF